MPDDVGPYHSVKRNRYLPWLDTPLAKRDTARLDVRSSGGLVSKVDSCPAVRPLLAYPLQNLASSRDVMVPGTDGKRPDGTGAVHEWVMSAAAIAGGVSAAAFGTARRVSDVGDMRSSPLWLGLPALVFGSNCAAVIERSIPEPRWECCCKQRNGPIARGRQGRSTMFLCTLRLLSPAATWPAWAF